MCESESNAQHLSATRGHLLEGLFARQEAERQRIAYELREGALQHLVALALTLDCLKDELASAGRSTRERLTSARDLVRAPIRDVRRLAADLRPLLLDHLGLGAALRSYARTRLSESGVHIRCDVPDMEPRPSPLVEISLYRTAVEAIDNIATHAEAKTVSITLKCDQRFLTLVVEDDGMGFEPANVLADPEAARSVGIWIMRERMASAGGSLSIQSSLGRGTRVRAELPLEREPSLP